VLFNIFINDLFDDLPYTGVMILSGKANRCVTEPPLVLPGFLFADDALGLAATKEQLVFLCHHVGEWMAENKIRIGISKCGVMVFGSNGHGGQATTCSLLDPAYSPNLLISLEVVPLVEEYLYLSISITLALNTKDLIAPHFVSR